MILFNCPKTVTGAPAPSVLAQDQPGRPGVLHLVFTRNIPKLSDCPRPLGMGTRRESTASAVQVHTLRRQLWFLLATAPLDPQQARSHKTSMLKRLVLDLPDPIQ